MLNKPPKKIQELFTQGFFQELEQHSTKRQHINDHWQQVVSADLARYTQCVSLQQGVLTVNTLSASWATRIRLTQKRIIEGFRSKHGIEVEQVQVHIKPHLDT